METQSSAQDPKGAAYKDRIRIHELMNCSKHQMDLIPLDAKEEWSFAKEHMIRLQGAHGEDIVRTFFVDEKVRIRSNRFDAVIESATSLLSFFLAVRMATFEPFVRKWMRQEPRLSKRLLQSRKSRRRARVRRSGSNRTNGPHCFETSMMIHNYFQSVRQFLRWPAG